MTDDRPSPTLSSKDQTTPALTTKLTAVRFFTGAFIAAPFAYGLYALTMAIAHTFAEKPLASSSALAMKISVMVRTLVVGVGALGTGIFTITTLGLVLLGLQLLVKKEPSQTN